MTMPVERDRATLAEYARRERDSVEKHEYRDGEIISMAGGTARHSLIVANIIRELGTSLKRKPCHVYDSNLRVGIARRMLYTYPDATVVCGPCVFDDADPSGETLTNPRVIVEVLSPSTEGYDRGEKFDRYREMESLEEYVLVSQVTPRVEVLQRQGQGAWMITWASGLEAIAKIRCLDVELPLTEIYAGVEFSA